MFLIVLFFLALSSVILILMRHDKQMVLILGLCFSFICMYIGIMIYTAKTGGVSPVQKQLIFLDTSIQRWLSYLPLPLKKLGYLIAVGRYLFPAFFLLTAIHYSMAPVVVRYKNQIWIFLLLPAASLVIYYPAVFQRLQGYGLGLLKAVMEVTVTWILCYMAAGAAILLQEYGSMTIPYCKKQFRYIILFLMTLALLYCVYCIQDPIQVYQMYSAEYMSVIGKSYIKYLSLSTGTWSVVLIGGVTTLLMAVGFLNLRSYTLLNKEEDRGELSMERKFDTASMGISVFVHSIKNQILANRVVYKKMWKELNREAPDLEQLRTCTKTLETVNSSMLERLDELYKSVKTNRIFLYPISSAAIAEEAFKRFKRKYPEVEVKRDTDTCDNVLADQEHLSEALANLLANGHEAFLSSGKPKELLQLRMCNERLYVRFEIRDNGRGMSKSEQRKIFDPFYTSKNTNFNWGMGLYYVRQIVKSHLGMLRVESTEGEGSCFFVMIPRCAPRQEKDIKNDKNYRGRRF